VTLTVSVRHYALCIHFQNKSEPAGQLC
jgi:hypothetical protein